MRLKKKDIEFMTHGVIILLVMFIGIGVNVSGMTMSMHSAEEQQVSEVPETERPQDMASTHEDSPEDYELIDITVGTETRRAEDTMEAQPTIKQCPRFAHSRDWSEHEQYLLAKLAMCEAGTQSVQTKCLVILTVYNRVHDNRFPNTIEDVIYQNDGKTWQYSPLMPGGSWNRLEPDEDCYEAVAMVMLEQFDYSGGAMYFESFGTDEEAANSWHGKCLEYLYQSDDIRFYK